MEIMNHGEKHIACVLLVDISGSMSGQSMEELNRGLQEFAQALQEDDKAYGCADVCVISFASQVRTVVPFCAAADYQAPRLSAGGLTALNEAIITGLDAVEMRKQEYKDLGVDYWRPWIFLLTDGAPTDHELEADARRRLQEALKGNKINFFPMGIGNADLPTLKSYTLDGSGLVLRAEKNNFKEAFVWLSKSMVAASNSSPLTEHLNPPPIPATITIAL